MTIESYPFGSGDGTGVNESEWGNMASWYVRTGVHPGLLNKLEGFADSTGMQVKAKTGSANVEGHYVSSDAEETVAVTASHATLDRIDLLVLSVNFVTDVATFKVVAGTAAGSPVAPSPVRTSSEHQLVLAHILVEALVATIAAAKVTDKRVYSGHHTTLPFGFASPGATDEIWTYLPKNVYVQILGYRLSGDVSGSIQIDLRHDVDFASITDADSLNPGAECILSTAQEIEDFDLSDWATTLLSEGCLQAYIDSVTTIAKAVLVLDVVLYPKGN